MTDLRLRILSAADLTQAVPMSSAIDRVRAAFAQLVRGKAVSPLRVAIEIPKHDGIALFMPSYLAGSESLAVKAVSVYPGNAERGLPTINGVVLALDPVTGRAIGLLNGTFVTTLRTGAVTGVAADLLALPGAATLALFGAGGQAWHQFEAVAAVRPLRDVRVYTRHPDAARALVERIARERPLLSARVAASPKEAVSDAEIVVTSTSSPTPVFDGRDLSPGAHVSAIGAFTPATRELDDATITRARLFADQRSACMAEAGDFLIPLGRGLIGEDAILAELGELITGTRPGRLTKADITVFKSVGNAIQDAAVAGFALAEAERLSLGTVVTL